MKNMNMNININININKKRKKERKKSDFYQLSWFAYRQIKMRRINFMISREKKVKKIQNHMK